MEQLQASSQNCFSTALLDRVGEKRKDPEWIEEQLSRSDTGFIPVWGEQNLVHARDDSRAVILSKRDLAKLLADYPTPFFLGTYNGRSFFGVDLPCEDQTIPEKFSLFGQFENMIRVGMFLNDLDGELLVFAKALAYWHRTNKFCGVCGSPNESSDGGHLLVCTNEKCKREHFPRTDPAIIVLVRSGDKCLLGRQPQWPEGWYSTLAGFVEPGESVESAVIREVFEESGVRVKGVTYHSSQPWPFPRSIMLGFKAEAETTEIHVDGRELEKAAWFSRQEIHDSLQSKKLRLPPRVSISRSLIDDWYYGPPKT